MLNFENIFCYSVKIYISDLYRILYLKAVQVQ